MNVLLAVFKKEIRRILSDKKLFFASVVLPGLLIYVILNMTGRMTDMLISVDDNHVHEVHAVNMPDSIAALLSPAELGLSIIPAAEADTIRIREEIASQDTDILLVFPPNFDAIVAGFDPLTATGTAPNVEIWSNSANTSSALAHHIVASVINAYHHSLTHRFSINAPSAAAPDGIFDLASATDIVTMMLGMMLPMMFILFIFTGSQSLVPESVAGEKERGTLGTLLVTTASRKQLALGKIMGLAVFALLGALGSFVGLMFSMGGMIPDVGDIIGSVSVTDIFSLQDFVLIFLIAVSLSLFFVALLSVLSTYSKSVKEANAMATPLTVVILAGAIGGGLVGATVDSTIMHLIPIFNASLAITAIINSDISVLNITVAIVTNFVLALGLTGVVAAMFNSEKIVFD